MLLRGITLCKWHVHSRWSVHIELCKEFLKNIQGHQQGLVELQYPHLRWFYVAKLDIHIVHIVVNHRQAYVVHISVSGKNSSFLVPEMCTTCDHTLVFDSSASDVSSEHSCTPDSSVLGLYLLLNNQLPLAFALLKGVQGRGWECLT